MQHVVQRTHSTSDRDNVGECRNEGNRNMLFGEQFQTFLDAVIAIFLNIIMAQYSAFFTLAELFQNLAGGGA